MAENNRILLFSGGLDSVILKQMFDFGQNECLFVKMNTPENRLEEAYIDKFFPGVHKAYLPLSQYSLPNNIIPFRNNMLALIGAQYSNNIYFAFTSGDTTKDKDYVFKAQMEGMLNYFATSPDKVHYQAPYTIHIPFKPFSKTELLSNYMDKFGFRNTKSILLLSRSCYSGDNKECGKCRSCLRKYVAACATHPDLGEAVKEWMQEDPTEHIFTFFDESQKKGRSEKELEDIKKCIE